jgi:hypothetical protein
MACGTANDGVWIVPAFQSTDFTAKGTMTWTVDKGDVHTWAYTRIGNAVIASFMIGGTSVGGTPTEELRIMLPAAVVVARDATGLIRIIDGAGVFVPGWASVTVGQNFIALRRLDNSNFLVSTNQTSVYGQIVIEVLN